MLGQGWMARCIRPSGASGADRWKPKVAGSLPVGSWLGNTRKCRRERRRKAEERKGKTRKSSANEGLLNYVKMGEFDCRDKVALRFH